MDFTQNMNNMLDKLDKFFKTETVVGDPITVENVTLVPITSVSFGFGGAGGGGKDPAGGDGMGSGAGAGGKITPTAILIIRDGEVRVASLTERDALEKIIGMVPEILARVMPEKALTEPQAPQAPEAPEQEV